MLWSALPLQWLGQHIPKQHAELCGLSALHVKSEVGQHDINAEPNRILHITSSRTTVDGGNLTPL